MVLVIEHDSDFMRVEVAVDYLSVKGRGWTKLKEGNPDGLPSEFQRNESC